MRAAFSAAVAVAVAVVAVLDTGAGVNAHPTPVSCCGRDKAIGATRSSSRSGTVSTELIVIDAPSTVSPLALHRPAVPRFHVVAWKLYRLYSV